MSVPQRGEVWMVDLGLAAKVRPCLVLSIPGKGEERSLVTLIPHTRVSGFDIAICEKGYYKRPIDKPN